MTTNQKFIQLQNTVRGLHDFMIPIAMSVNVIDDNQMIVVAHDTHKDEYIVWDYNISHNGLYNGHYSFDENDAMRNFAKRITK